VTGQSEEDGGKRTLVGVLVSHDSPEKHVEVLEAFGELYSRHRHHLDRLHFVFTGGTFERIVLGTQRCSPSGAPVRHYRAMRQQLEAELKRQEAVRGFLLENSTALPTRADGGLELLANLVIHHQCELLWPFLSAATPHLVSSHNLALLRLSDICFAKKYMNKTSVLRWADEEADRDVVRCPQKVTPLEIELGTDKSDVPYRPWPKAALFTTGQKAYWKVTLGRPEGESPSEEGTFPVEWSATDPETRKDVTIGLIAHDEMKLQMVDFATQYERELEGFRRIVTTGTTGAEIKKRCHKLSDKVKPCQSGPYGGDLEIAAEILAGRCQVVVFFVDPLHPHPHADDIRVVFAACMNRNSQVLILSNELQAREWFDTLRF
jgi:methylglyoxal synthase